MASIVEQPWRRVSGPSPSSPKNVHCLSGGVENVDNKRQNLGKPPSPPRSSSPTCPPAKDVDSDSSEGSIPNTPPQSTSSTTKVRTASLSSSLPLAALPQVGDNTVPKTQLRQHHVVVRDWNDAHDGTRGPLSNTPSPQHAGGNRDNGAADMTRVTLPSLDIPRYRTPSSTSALVHNNRSPDSTPSTRSSSNSIPDYVRRASFASERTGWSASPPTSMPPPPLPSQSCAPQLDSYPRITERTPALPPRTNPLSVSELIHREATGTELPQAPRTDTTAAADDQPPSLASEFMEALNLGERISDDNMSRFLDELNHQLSLTGILHEARDVICRSLELGERHRSAFVSHTRHLLMTENEPARDMRDVVARATVGMSQREMARFEHEVGHMLDGSQHKPTSPFREAICCAAYAARFPEDQLAELKKQLRRTPLAAFKSALYQQQHLNNNNNNNSNSNSNNNVAGAGQQQQHQTSLHNLPPPRECEKAVEVRRPGAGSVRGRKDPPRPTNVSLREFPILLSG